MDLRYELPKYGEFEMLGEVIRKERKGIVVKFHNVNRDTRIKLRDYIKENITEGGDNLSILWFPKCIIWAEESERE